MTDRKSRRVVIINNINSDTIDQAIFILKSDKKDAQLSKSADGDIVREAQNIINNYIRQVERLKCPVSGNIKAGKRRKKGFRSFATVASAIFCIALMFVIIGYVIR